MLKLTKLAPHCQPDWRALFSAQVSVAVLAAGPGGGVRHGRELCGCVGAGTGCSPHLLLLTRRGAAIAKRVLGLLLVAVVAGAVLFKVGLSTLR